MIKENFKQPILTVTVILGFILGDLALPLLGADIELRKLLYLALAIVILKELLDDKDSFIKILRIVWPYIVLIFIFVDYSRSRSVLVAAEISIFTAIAISLHVLYRTQLRRIRLYFKLQTILTVLVILAGLIHNLPDLLGFGPMVDWHFNASYIINGVWKREALLFKESTTLGFLVACIAPFYIKLLLRIGSRAFFINAFGYAVFITLVGSFLALFSILLYLLLVTPLLVGCRRRVVTIFIFILTGAIIVNLSSRILNTTDIFEKFGTVKALAVSSHTYAKWGDVSVGEVSTETSTEARTERSTESVTEFSKQPQDFGGSLVLISHLQALSERFKQEPGWNTFVGQGLGLYQDSYFRYIPKWSEDLWGPGGLAANDGGSLFIRLLVEIGIIGTLLYFILYAVFLNYVCRYSSSWKKRLLLIIHIFLIMVFMLLRIPFYDEPIFYLTLISIINLVSRSRAEKRPL